ncbi:CPCC family cysteine-rich protein [Micromonospora sp. NPDC007271]
MAGGPNGDVSLSDARLNFAIYGASHRRYLDVVRQPRSDELP